MLIDFTVENFHSIKEPATLSAIAQKTKVVSPANADTKYVKSDAEIAPSFEVEGWGFELLPVLGIFGANASGKSNVIHALDYLLNLMSPSPAKSYEKLKLLQPFMLDSTSRTMPIRFDLRVALEQIVYTYSLRATRERVTFERLYVSPVSTKRERLLYSRSWDAQRKQYEWKNGASFGGPPAQLEGSLAGKDTFLGLLTRLNISNTDPLRHWLLSHPMGVGHSWEWLDEWGAAQAAHETPEHLARISAIVRLFDTGVQRFEVEKPHPEEDGPNQYEIWAWHETKEGEVRFPLSGESAGTRRLFGLANNILEALDRGTVLLVDELGSSLHPNITRTLVQLFQSPKTNPRRAQLIFASHDNTLQRRHLLRRDQIWFTQKDAEGRTTLCPLSDYRPRNGTAIDRAYLDGRYEAIPSLPDEEELAAVTAGRHDAA